MKPCKRGGFGPRAKSGHCRCENCKRHYSMKAKERSEKPQRKTKCKNGNVAERGKWGHCLCNECHSARREASKGYTKKWASNNEEKRKEAVNNWRERNPESVARMWKRGGHRWYVKNKAKVLAASRARQIAKIQRTPVWADLEAIEKIYEDAKRISDELGVPHEVDHIIPLQGETVSGLHVHWNLQIISRTENRKKGNKFGGEEWERG